MGPAEFGDLYPSLVKDTFNTIIDAPPSCQLRVDANGEQKDQERKLARKLAIDFPPGIAQERIVNLKTIYLQWLDTKSDPSRVHWHDTQIVIDMDKKRLWRNSPSFLLGNHEHNESFGWVFTIPVLLIASPYLYVRHKLYNRQETKHGMSRHGIALLKKLDGQLDRDTQALLTTALRNEWKRELKHRQTPTLEEAIKLLDNCKMREMIYEADEVQGKLHECVWFDDDDDYVAQVVLESDKLHQANVFNFKPSEVDARELMKHFKERSIETVPRVNR